MKIELKEISVRDLTNGYQDNEENGVVGFGGKLDIRPPYQREFVYNPKERDAVINTLQKNFPLNVMYWAVREDGNFEVIDGQQRTISICQYVNGDFSIDGLAFHNLPKDKQDQILNYTLMVYYCSGTSRCRKRMGRNEEETQRKGMRHIGLFAGIGQVRPCPDKEYDLHFDRGIHFRTKE